MRMTGQVLPKSKKPLRISCNRKSTPTVTTMTGPMRPRVVQRWHAQRIRSLICRKPLQNRLLLAVHAIAKHKNAHGN